MKVRIGTRGSDLALWQARHIAALFAQHGVESEIIVLKTRGDLIDDVPLSKVEGKAFFTAEIERALLDHEVDVAVHSHKDLPTEMTPGLVIAAVPPRATHNERLLVHPRAYDEKAAFLPLKLGAKVGTSAPRRLEQLKTLRPDLEVLDLRGNVPTRVRKAREGIYDAVVLAAAGLDRLALSTEGLVAFDLPIELFVPAPAQGALGIQVRSDDRAVFELCHSKLHDAATERDIAAERSLLVSAGGGCSLPLGAAISRRAGASRWTAHAFLGAGHPVDSRFARWCTAEGDAPQTAIDAALAMLANGRATKTGPLGGLRVALTGSAGDGSVLGERLAALGADVVQERVIELEELPGVDLAGFVARAKSGDVLVVTSRNAARALQGLKVAAGVKFAAVGQACARTLSESGFEAQWVGEGGGRALAAQITVAAGGKVYWPCAQDAVLELEEALRERGVGVERLAIYRTKLSTNVQLERNVDVRVYMSPSAVDACLTWERAHPQTTTRRFALGNSTAAACERVSLAAQSPRCVAGPITEELVRELRLLRTKSSAAPAGTSR